MKFLGKKDKETHKLPFAKQCAPQCGAQGTQRSAKQMAPNGGKLPMGKRAGRRLQSMRRWCCA